MHLPFAVVHHANQYLITDGYENRDGLNAVLGERNSTTGLWRVLELHRVHRIPANLHISGTLLEAIAWYQPDFLCQLRALYVEGLIEFVGSCYGQNLMRFFGYDHNLKQLNEELQLYQVHLRVDPVEIKIFWPPERLWDTHRMAPVLRDSRLDNRGYQAILVDDRLLLPADGNPSLRRRYDREQTWDPQLFRMYRIQHAQGLVALPIANNLRQSIPPRGPHHWRNLESQLRWLGALNHSFYEGDLVAIYADDMEKTAGVGWDREGPSQFEAFLQWLLANPWIRPLKLSEWVSSSNSAGAKPIQTGTFLELANHFDGGENYEKWYFDPAWSPYRTYFSWSESRVKELESLGADPSLMALAHKHLLASSWETAWHTPSTGAHGDPGSCGGPSAWAKVLASHSRHAAVIAEAAFWRTHRDDEAYAYLQDIDHDGNEELILKNNTLFAVFSPRYGGRLLFLFSVEGQTGRMVVGNPTDDWNLLEELNEYMDVPRNHPGALADAGFEHDAYKATLIIPSGPGVYARLQNDQPDSRANGLVKDIFLVENEVALRVDYTLPEALSGIDVEFGFSPDYLNLLRNGRCLLREHNAAGARGWGAGGVDVWVRPDDQANCRWTEPYQEEFGHGRSVRVSALSRQITLHIGVDLAAAQIADEEKEEWQQTTEEELR